MKLTDIQAACEAATKGPWVQWLGHTNIYAGIPTSNDLCHITGDIELVALFPDNDIPPIEQEANATFIALSREAVPKLLAVIHALDYVMDKGMITYSDDSDHDALHALVAARKALAE